MTDNLLWNYGELGASTTPMTPAAGTAPNLVFGGWDRMIQALLAASGTEQDLYRIALYGRPDTALGVRTEVLQEALADKAFYLELSDQTEPPYDFAALAKEQSLRGRFVQLMQERIDKASGDEKEVAVRALRMGVEALGQS